MHNLLHDLTNHQILPFVTLRVLRGWYIRYYFVSFLVHFLLLTTKRTKFTKGLWEIHKFFSSCFFVFFVVHLFVIISLASWFTFFFSPRRARSSRRGYRKFIKEILVFSHGPTQNDTDGLLWVVGCLLFFLSALSFQPWSLVRAKVLNLELWIKN